MKQLLYWALCLVASAWWGQALQAQTIDLSQFDQLKKVPADQLVEFESSFVFEEGLFRGADISPLQPYLAQTEIESLVEAMARSTQTEVRKQSGPKVFFDKRPITRGCKPKKNWVCVVYGDIVH